MENHNAIHTCQFASKNHIPVFLRMEEIINPRIYLPYTNLPKGKIPITAEHF
jgi:hypothetical protein